MTNKNRFMLADWIWGKSSMGELIHGFIEEVEEEKDIVKVHVVKSDHKDTVGKSIWLRNSRVRKLPDQKDMNEVQLQTLIDVALSTKDEQWFHELTSKLNEDRNAASKSNKNVKPSFRKNRFGDPFQKYTN